MMKWKRSIVFTLLILSSSGFAQNTTRAAPDQPGNPQAPPAPVAQSSASGSNGFGFGTGAPGTGGGGGFGANGGAGSGGGAGTSLGGSGGGVGVSDGSSAIGSGCTTGSCGGGAALGGGPLGSSVGSSTGSNGFGFGSGAQGSGGGGGFGANGGGGSGGGAGNQFGGTGGGAGASNGSLASGSGATNSSAGGGVVTGKGIAPVPMFTSGPADAQVGNTAPSLGGDASSPSMPAAQTQVPPAPMTSPTPSPNVLQTDPPSTATSALTSGPQPTPGVPVATAKVSTTKTPAPVITAIVPIAEVDTSDGQVTSTSYSGDSPYPSSVPVAAKQGDVVIVDMAKPDEKKSINCTTGELPKVVVKPSHDKSKCYVKQERCCPVEYACGYDCHNKWFKVCKAEGQCEWFNEKKCYPKICEQDKCVMLGRVEGPAWTPSPAPTVHWNVVVTKIEK